MKRESHSCDSVSILCEPKCSWEVDQYCPHCPHIEPCAKYSSGGKHDPRPSRVGALQADVDGICLHAMAYYNATPDPKCTTYEDGGVHKNWSWVCPSKLMPDWVTSMLSCEKLDAFVASVNSCR